MAKREAALRMNQTISDYVVEKTCAVRNMDRRNLDQRVASAVGRDLVWMEELEKTLKAVFVPGSCKPARPYKGKKAKHREREVNVILSDLHYQSLLDPREVPSQYGPVEESRRTGKVAVQVADYKRQYRHETKLRANIIGDIIQNQLHDPRDGSPLTLQFAAALYYLLQLVTFWASEFPEVEVCCVPGNHGRNMARHPHRAIHQKWDSIETMLYVSLQRACEAAKLTNVKFVIPMTPYYTVEMFDQKGFFTHGDTVLKPGYPGKSINVEDLYHQICRWNTAKRIEGPFNMFAVGHVHFGSVTNMPGQVVMVTNGCLVPPDPFAISIGSPDVTCGQYVFESVRGHAVGDQRFINVDDADSEPEYNKVIRPFEGL